MKLRIRRFAAMAAFLSCVLASAQALAQEEIAYIPAANGIWQINALTNELLGPPVDIGGFSAVAAGPFRNGSGQVYVTNVHSKTVGVIDATRNTRTFFGATISVGDKPIAVAVTPDGSKVYVANSGSGTVSVIDTRTNTVTATIPLTHYPAGLAVTPNGKKVYVANRSSNSVSVIDTGTNAVTATIRVGDRPEGVAVAPDGSKVYVANYISGTVSVIDTGTSTVIATIDTPHGPSGVAVTPNGRKVYETNYGDDNVLVIDATTNAAIKKIDVDQNPSGVAVTPDGREVYVVNQSPDLSAGSVSVIDTGTDTVTATIRVGSDPAAFGEFIEALSSLPAPFAGTPGFSNCAGQSIAALDRQYRGRNGAAAAMGFPDVEVLENAVLAFCR